MEPKLPRGLGSVSGHFRARQGEREQAEQQSVQSVRGNSLTLCDGRERHERALTGVFALLSEERLQMWRLVAEHATHIADPLVFIPTGHSILQNSKAALGLLTPHSGWGRFFWVAQAIASV